MSVKAKLQARAAHRQRVHGFKAKPAQQLGLTVLQFEKVGHHARRNFQREWDEFRRWCQERGVNPTLVEQVNTMMPLYLDALFFAGYNHDRADKLYAALRYFLPNAGISNHAKMEATLAAMKGYRRLGHGQTRAPLAKPMVFAAVGLAVRWGWHDMALALCLSWDAYLRLPSDLLQLTGASLVPPVQVGGQSLTAAGSWALLLYPEEQPLRSKAGQFDESVALTPFMSKVIGRRLQQLKEAAGPKERVWSMTAYEFGRKFRALFRALGRDSARPYQVRHGAASCDAAEGSPLADIQHRLRHATDRSSKRYAKHARYLAELAAAPKPVLNYGHQVTAQLAEGIAGKCQPALPAMMMTAAP